MIEGLKVTVHGGKLRDLCLQRCAYHADRADKYRDQIEQMKAAQVEGMAYTNGDPIKALEDRKANHESEAAELLFIADHLVPDHYLLGKEDLVKLGICKSRY
jgi:hypothetical protein